MLVWGPCPRRVWGFERCCIKSPCCRCNVPRAGGVGRLSMGCRAKSWELSSPWGKFPWSITTWQCKVQSSSPKDQPQTWSAYYKLTISVSSTSCLFLLMFNHSMALTSTFFYYYSFYTLLINNNARLQTTIANDHLHHHTRMTTNDEQGTRDASASRVPGIVL